MIYKCFEPGNFSASDWTDLCPALSRLDCPLFQRICGPPLSYSDLTFSPVPAGLVLHQVFSRFNPDCHWLFVFEKGRTKHTVKAKSTPSFSPFLIPVIFSGKGKIPQTLAWLFILPWAWFSYLKIENVKQNVFCLGN